MRRSSPITVSPAMKISALKTARVTERNKYFHNFHRRRWPAVANKYHSRKSRDYDETEPM